MRIDDPRKFYKNVSISKADGLFEINLDKNKLKTPLGTLFRVPTEPLAVAVATEWDSQKEMIKKHSMHLTSLCNTAIDNPTERSKETVIQSVLQFLETDTLCFRLDEPPELVELQTNHWDPVIQWFNDRYSADIKPTTAIISPTIAEETLENLKGHLRSHNEWSLVGIESAVHSLKSLILAFALIDRRVDPETALKLSWLELEFQVAKWGRVEWSHDVEFADLKARVSAAGLFIHMVLESTQTIQKMTS
ncbi:putative ATP synthase mitochondrial F1 complex assembly factor 2-like [Apostichopus japonicus]|uniref:Putative ATP synthase mitochondrial F1 complex assembly factor 2-like n=1 Tax=Stichopus japonicus TaxID=307972 RepID=A0A2G8L3Z6_STIJA|nr:putative ATP synthase mitochondrial F1 complex assembly factor 2-like [Apostichopus japonicus]